MVSSAGGRWGPTRVRLKPHEEVPLLAEAGFSEFPGPQQAGWAPLDGGESPYMPLPKLKAQHSERCGICVGRGVGLRWRKWLLWLPQTDWLCPSPTESLPFPLELPACQAQ